MLGAGMIKIGEFIKSELAISFGFAQQVCASAAVGRQLVQMLHASMTGVRGINFMQAATASDLLDSRMEKAGNQAILKCLVEVAHFPELVLDPAGIDALFVMPELGRAEIVVEQRVKSSFCGEHSALDGQVNAFEPLRVKEAGRVADDHPATARKRRHGEPATIRKRLGSIANHLATAQQAGNQRMRFEILQHALGIKTRVLIVEAGNVS